MSHMTCDKSTMTRDTWHIYSGMNILSKFQLPSSYVIRFYYKQSLSNVDFCVCPNMFFSKTLVR